MALLSPQTKHEWVWGNSRMATIGGATAAQRKKI
jgi:hypothetical protein